MHSFSFIVVAVVLLGVASAQYSPYSPHPMPNARSSAVRKNGNGNGNAISNGNGYGATNGNGNANGNGNGYGATNGNGNGNRASSTYSRAQEFRDDSARQRSRPSYGGAANGQRSMNGFNGEAIVSGFANGNGYSNGNGRSSQLYGGSSAQQYSQEQQSQPSPNDPDGDSIVGMAGRDYPTHTQPPTTSFQCSSQPLPGYYADPEAQCQVFHICQRDGRHDSFVCPIGSIFNQKYFVCDWWYNVNCADAPSFYNLNAELYKDPVTSSRLSAGGYGGYAQNGASVSNGIQAGSYGGQNGANGAARIQNGAAYQNGDNNGASVAGESAGYLRADTQPSPGY